MSEGATKSEDLWTPYKDLYRTINYYLCEEGQNANPAEFENTLRRHKQNFFALLQNPPKSAKSREELRKGMEDGITIKEIGHQVLSRDLYQEALILSDMYDINEFVALDLLCTAQIQMPYYYGLPRGLVAILLYYDGRKCIVSSLRLLVQARKGVSWSINVPQELVNFITTFTDQLAENGLFSRIFELLRTSDLSKELEKLQENVALGGPRHRRQVIDLFNDIRQCLSEIVFLWSAQCGLPREPTLGLLNYLRQLKVEEDAAGTIDNVTFYLLMALLSAMDLSILHIREDGEDMVQNLPILCDKDYIPTLCAEFLPSKPKWVSEGLQAVATFGFAVAVACLRLVPQCTELQGAIDQEVTFLCTAIDMKVFDFLINKVLSNETLYSDEILVRRIHYLLTDFIVQMFAKVKELRIKADETARMMQVYVHEGLEPPTNLPRHFEHFMQAITKFYSEDPLNLHYSLDYWCPIESTHESYSYRAPPRSVSLFKFIRLAGDLVPSSLFVPFINMLSSLSTSQQAARHCFNMLKQAGPGYSNSVSWDHFFMSFNQYYNNLKQEVPPLTDTVYRRGVHHKGITPQEIEGLHAVLKLIRNIADYDDFSRLALCEHPGWAPLTILLGLVGCSIPISVKADLLLTLAALAKSPETAAQMWNNVEASQILVTVPTTSSYQPRGIQTELDEIESRMEEYPLTKALLKLLDVLTDSGIPRTLGAGPRKPGFDPYLTFIVNSVFLKFNARSYKNPEERWLIGSMCLKLLDKFLMQYEPQPSDFTNSNKPNEFNPPPGFHLMLQLNSRSEFLNLVLYIAEEGHRLFQQFVSFAGQSYVEDCTFKCLNVLERAQVLQSTFSGLLSASPNPILLTNVNKLLLIINPRSSQPDYLLNISKYIGHQYLLAKHALAATKILVHVTSSPSLHSQFLNILLSNDKDSKLIRSGFVECLDATGSREDAEITTTIKEVVLKLLKQCLSYSSPNLSHFLLGFDLKHDLSQTIFQNPGVLDFPRTCLHSIFTILKSAVAKEIHTPPATLLESAYHMLYLLCANYKTSEPVLRFIRQNQKFFHDHLFFCSENANDSVSQLNQLSWLLKTVAIELKITCSGSQIFYLQQLSTLLVGVPEPIKDIPIDMFSVIRKAGPSRMDETMSVFPLESTKSDRLLLKLITKFELNVEEVLTPRWDYFDSNVLDSLIENCQTDTTPKLIDIRKLHHTLIDEIGTLHANAAIGQRQAIMQEIQKVLLHALNINNSRNAAAAIVRFVDAWRQVVEVFAIYMPFQVLSTTEQQIFNVCLLENLCKKVANINLLPEVASHLSGAVLVLLENIWRCHTKERQQLIHKRGEDSDSTRSTIQGNAESLKLILSYLIEWAMSADGTSQTLKINLYASLVTFLRLVHLHEPIQSAELESSFYISRLDSSRLHISRDATSFYLPTDAFVKFGEKLTELVCHDCIGGHDVSKMLAMATSSMFVNMSGNINWVVYMAGRGYMKHLIESILNSDDDLKLLLEPVPQNLRPLYLYVSKLSLLTQLATTRVGAELLLEQRILSCLSNMRVFELHPEILKQVQIPPEGLEDFVPPVENRYLQIFVPTLHLCNSLVTSLSAENRSAVGQIMYYLLSHLEIIEFVLRSGGPALSQNFLEELSALTSIIARIAACNVNFMAQSTESIQDNRAHFYRIQKLMLSLLPKFLLSADVIRELLANPQQENATYQTSNRLLLVFQIIANLITYSRNLAGVDGVDHSSVSVVFQPTLGDTFINFNSRQSANSEKSPTLGVVVQHLTNTVNYYHEEKSTLSFLQCKVNEIPEMSSADLKEFMKLPQQVYDVSTARENALELVSDKLNKKKREFDHCAFIIDNCLYLLWAHLDYYMLKAIPRIRQGEVSDLSASFNVNATLASASEATWKVSTDDISHLKQGLVSVFNDSFSRQLLETTQGGADVHRQFIETLLRKIKRLIQFVPVK